MKTAGGIQMNEYIKNAKLSHYHTNKKKKELHKLKQGLGQIQFNTRTWTHENTRLHTQDFQIGQIKESALIT